MPCPSLRGGGEEYFAPYFNAQGFETHSVSLRHHGGSGDNTKVRWVPISAYVKNIKQAIGQIGQPPILVGHPMADYCHRSWRGIRRWRRWSLWPRCRLPDYFRRSGGVLVHGAGHGEKARGQGDDDVPATAADGAEVMVAAVQDQFTNGKLAEDEVYERSLKVLIKLLKAEAALIA